MSQIIIELLSSHGHKGPHRYVFGGGMATIGRSYSNDIILDDPFVSPKHLSVSRNGKFIYVTDLASENGTKFKEGITLKNQSAKFESGDEISIGKTKLKLLLPDHRVEPAKRMNKLAPLRQFSDRRSVTVVSSILAAIFFNCMIYLEDPSGKFFGEQFIIMAIMYMIIALIYAGIFCLITYFKIHKVYFKSHLVVFNAATLLSFIYFMITPFLYFWVLQNIYVIIADTIINLLIMLIMLAASFGLYKEFFTRRDLIKLAMISLLFTLPDLLVNNDTLLGFSGKPSYQAKLAPYLKPLTEPLPLDAFLENAGHKLFKSPE